jgi:hypothetical protein
VLTSVSITQVVRLSGNCILSTIAIQLELVVKSACQNAVSLKFHLFFFESHHFTTSQAPHFSQLEESFTSSFSTKFFSEVNIVVHKYLFMS